MPTERLLPVSITARSGEKNKAELHVHTWTENERKRRSIKAGAIGSGITIACVFLPIAHFVLVPAGLISTPLVTWLIFKQTESIPKQYLACPKCSAQVEWPSSSKFTKTELLCDKCRSVLEVESL